MLVGALGAFLAVVAAFVGAPSYVHDLAPRQKAALLVVSGLPAPSRVGGVILFAVDRKASRPKVALVYTDQEGGVVKRFPGLPPFAAAADYRTRRAAFTAGVRTGAALRRAGVDVDLAPVLDAPDGPLGSRHFARQELGVAFGRGLLAAGVGACAKHFPGLGSTAVTTDSRRPVMGIVRASELAGFRRAVRAGVPCVMVSHAIYERLGPRPASLSKGTYDLLRDLGFDGVAITDELGVIGPDAASLARRAVSAGADLVLFSSPDAAGRAIEALLPAARRGALDEHVARVLAFRAKYRT
jgi:beta-N-acetylhexosaminidase